MDSSISRQKLHLGAAYYPEHWPEERWNEDIRLMQEAGMSVVRMAEFAWSTMEPVAGKFNFAWLVLAIEKLAAAGIVSVLGTPPQLHRHGWFQTIRTFLRWMKTVVVSSSAIAVTIVSILLSFTRQCCASWRRWESNLAPIQMNRLAV